MTSFEIFDFWIHLLSWDMIFFTYAFTWSSSDTIIFKPYFLTLWKLSVAFRSRTHGQTHGAKSSGGYTPLWKRMVLAANSKNSTHSFDEPLSESLWTLDLSSLGLSALGFASRDFDDVFAVDIAAVLALLRWRKKVIVHVQSIQSAVSRLLKCSPLISQLKFVFGSVVAAETRSGRSPRDPWRTTLKKFESEGSIGRQAETKYRAITETSMRRCFIRPAHSALQALRLQPAAAPAWKPFQHGFHTAPTRLAAKLKSDLERRIEQIPIERFRNFCIVAHVDHGKSTLSDRLLELTGTIEKGGLKQSLDRLDVERERGITVKANTCSMVYNHNGEDYLLHLVDTPGHVDFRAEVSRSYASCGGALLLVDASQGVQAQTVANFYLAFAQDLTLVPVLNKVDLPTADRQRTLDQLRDTFEIDSTNAVSVSAKTGKNVEQLLPMIVEKIPAPTTKDNAPLKMLLVDSWYDNYKGVILLVRIFDGSIKPGDKVISFATGLQYTVGEVGIMYPLETSQTELRAGQVGYVYFNPGMKRSKDAKIGDTFTTVGNQDKVEMLPGFEEPKSMVFVSAFPTDQGDYSHLEDSIHQVTLNDRSVSIMKESSEALGAGWRMGFLGTLHCSVFEDRLRQEHGASIIITPPSVPFKIVRRDGSEEIMTNPNSFPDGQIIHQHIVDMQEPYITATITMPEEYLGTVIEMCEANRGQQDSLSFFTATQVILKYQLPLERLVDDFFGKLKSATKGYASLDYEDAGFKSSSITKLQLHVNKVPVDAVARVVHTSQAERLGKAWVTKFTKHVDRQMFEVVIQAVAGKKVVARETLKPFRKDVTAKLHAADISRRRKLLERQKEGRKKLRAVGNVAIDNKAFQSFLAK